MLLFIFVYFWEDNYNYAQLYGSIHLFSFNTVCLLFTSRESLSSGYLLYSSTLFLFGGCNIFFYNILLNVLLEVWVFCLYVCLFICFLCFPLWDDSLFPPDILIVCFVLWLLHGILLEFLGILFTTCSFKAQKAWWHANQVCVLVGFIIGGTG